MQMVHSPLSITIKFIEILEFIPDSNIGKLDRSHPEHEKLGRAGNMILLSWLRFQCYEMREGPNVELLNNPETKLY